MKKTNALLMTGLVLGILGSASIGASKAVKMAKADGLTTYIPMESGSFSNWTDAAGGFKASNATFWGERYSFEALDTFYSGESAEGWEGTLSLKAWNQSTQYIYFQLGSAMKDRVDGDNAHDGQPDAGTPVYLKIKYGSYSADFYNEHFIENPMYICYFKIPNDHYTALKALGDTFSMSIDIVDGKTRNYGFANFGYLHVNQTEDDVGNAMRYHLNHLADNTQINYDDHGDDRKTWAFNKRVAIYNIYRGDDYKDIFLKSAGDNVDENFNDTTTFLNHWYRDPSFENWQAADPRHPDDIISTATYRADGGKNMPFNNEGGFLRGWYEDGKGYVANDYPIYRFVSRPFKLSGTGLISIKMGGKATLHVLDATTQNKLASVDARYFNCTSGDEGNACATDFNTCTMVRHVINLSQFLNTDIQLAIVDREAATWAAAYFDELVTKYTTSTFTKFKVDTFNQKYANNDFRGFYFDKYIGVSDVSYEDNRSVSDSSIYQAAATFLETYQTALRSKGAGVTYCSLKKSNLTPVIDAYDAIVDSDVKALINASEDIDYTKAATGSTWYNIDASKGTVGASMVNIKARAASLQESNAVATIDVRNNSQVVVILVIALLTCAALAMFVVIKKRKQN